MNPVRLGREEVGGGERGPEKDGATTQLLVHSQSEPILISDLPGQLI